MLITGSLTDIRVYDIIIMYHSILRFMPFDCIELYYIVLKWLKSQPNYSVGYRLVCGAL